MQCPACRKTVAVPEDPDKTLPTTPPETATINTQASALVTISLQPGQMLGACRIERELGKGGMGVVYLATHTRLDIPVAVKVLPPHMVDVNPEFIDRFMREAKLAAKIQHPNVVAVMDVDRDPTTGLYYIVQQYVDGGTVKKLMVDGPVEPERTLAIAADVVEALVQAADLNIIHRDIKPDNIMLTKAGKAKLADLGLAKQLQEIDEGLDHSVSLTMKESTLGTPLYMSPEHAMNAKTCDIRSDIYSVGATMYHLLCGEPPFTGATHFELMKKHCDEIPAAPSSRIRNVPPELDAIILKCLEKSPSARYQSPGELLEDLSRVASKTALGSRSRVALLRQTSRRKAPGQKRRAIVLAAVIVVLAGCASLVTFLSKPSGDNREMVESLNEIPAAMQLVYSGAPTLPEPRFAGDAVIADGKIYYVGGHTTGKRKATSLLAYDIESKTWRTIDAPGFQGRTGLGVAVIEGVIYAAGGYTTVPDVKVFEAFDISKGVWSKEPDMINRCNSLSGSVVGYKGKVWVVGGNYYSEDRNTAQIYTREANSTGSWALGEPMLHGKRGTAVVVYDDKIWSIGAAGNMSRTVEAYDPVTRSWAKKASLPVPRGNAEAVVADDCIFLLGGIGRDSEDILRYTASEDKWKKVGTIPPAILRGQFSAVASGNRIWLIGGVGYKTGEALDRVDVITVTHSSEQQVGPDLEHPMDTHLSHISLPEPRSGFGHVMFDRALWVLGGASGPGAHRTFWKLPAGESTFMAMAPLSVPRRWVRLVECGGDLFAIGGSPDPVASKEVYKYSVDNNSWTRMADMNTARSAFGAATVAGRIFVFGGHNNGWPTSSAEVYDPLGNQWHLLPPLPYKAHCFNAVAGQDNRIYLLCCGQWHGPRKRDPSTDVLIYDPEEKSYVRGLNAPHEHLNSAVVPISDKEILVIGANKYIDVYNYRANTWREAGELHSPRSCAGAAMFDDVVWIIGGEILHKGISSSIVTYSLETLGLKPSARR